MLEKITISILTPILIYFFGYYLAEYMFNHYRATVSWCIPFMILTAILCAIALLRNYKPKLVNNILRICIFVGASTLILMASINVLRSHWFVESLFENAFIRESLIVIIICASYVFYVAIKTKYNALKQLTEKQVKIYAVTCLLAVVVSIFPVSSYIYYLIHNGLMILFATCFFVSGILYPVTILFSIYYDDKKFLECTESKAE